MKLDEYLASKLISDAEFAAAIDRDRSSVSRLRRGKTKPDWETAQRIYAATNGDVTPDDFLPAPIPQFPQSETNGAAS